MAWGSAEYSWTSKTPQSKDAFSFFNLEADGAILNKPYDAKEFWNKYEENNLKSNSKQK